MKLDFEVIFDRISTKIRAELPALITAMNVDKTEFAAVTGRELVLLEEIEDEYFLIERWVEGSPTTVPPYPVSYVLDWLNPQISSSGPAIAWKVPMAFHIIINENFEGNLSIMLLRYALIQADLITKHVNTIPDITGGVTIVDQDAVPIQDNIGHSFTACSIMFTIDLPI